MRQILFTIVLNAPVAFALAFATVLWSVYLLRTHSGENGALTPVDAARRAIQALLSFGAMGGQDKNNKGPDLSISGTLGTLVLAVGAYGLYRGEPVALPVFGYAASAATAFTVCGFIAFKLAPRLGVDAKLALSVAFLCAFFGVVGSRIFYVVQFWDDQFANQPARVTFGKLQVQKGDELIARTAQGEARAVFTGEEKTNEAIVARLADLKPAGVIAKPIEEKRRDATTLLTISRGFCVETEARGSGVALGLSGTVLRGLNNPIVAEGETTPWVRYVAVWQGGLVFYGGMIFGTAAVLIFVWIRGISVWHVGDLASAVGGIGVAFGRVGCFLNGCCWGRKVPADSAYALCFPPFSPAWYNHVHEVLPVDWDERIEMAGRQVTPEIAKALTDAGAPQLVTGSLPVHPVQLYAIGLDVLVGVIIISFVLKRVKREGQTFFLWFILYAIIRFIIEHFRGDHYGFGVVLGYPLTPSQRVALLTLPAAIVGFIWASRRGKVIVPLEAKPAPTGA
jgi:prolipoprotein diacylglyceryl transferase